MGRYLGPLGGWADRSGNCSILLGGCDFCWSNKTDNPERHWNQGGMGPKIIGGGPVLEGSQPERCRILGLVWKHGSRVTDRCYLQVSNWNIFITNLSPDTIAVSQTCLTEGLLFTFTAESV